MANEITNAEKIRRLPWNTALNATNTVYAQLSFFGSAFVLFLNALHFTNSEIGFLLSMLPFFGIVAVFIAPRVARFGYKRTYLTFFGTRKIVTAFLLLVPWVISEYGEDAGRLLVTIIMMAFALCRAVAEVGYYPWVQEYIPNSIRGKHSAINDMVSRIAGLLTVAAAGYILEVYTGLDGFMLMFSIAVVFGLMAVWSASHLPGGAPTQVEATSFRHLFKVFKDRNFSQYMLGLFLITLGSAPLGFLPLFMENEVGLSESAVVWLQTGTIIGGFSATYLMGWAADRYGSKPVMLSGLYVKALLPIGWLLMPRHSDLSLAIAFAIAAVWGIAEIAWAIGSGRLLFVSIVPSEKKSEYMAVFYTSIGLVGGISQIISGSVLDAFEGLSGEFMGFEIDQYTPLFVGVLVLTIFSGVLFRRVRADTDISVRAFAGMFMHGNPVLALESLVRYYRATDERATVFVTERMGSIKSLLTVDELLETLKDPRFNVRFEAIISISRMGPDSRLVNALCRILDGTEISLSVIAAWALGRMGDEQALPTLRKALDSPYKSIQAHAARSLGTLVDKETEPIFIERLKTETDKGLRIAYASALGHLHSKEALELLFHVLAETENEGARMELALSIARIAGDEQLFIRLLRNLRYDQGTVASQVILGWKRKLDKSVPAEIKMMVDECANLFASGQANEGAKQLAEIIALQAPTLNGKSDTRVLAECAVRLREYGAAHQEYLMLALHMLQLSEH